MDKLSAKDEAVKWITKPGNNFCALPFIHMAIEANGDIRPCCMGDELKNNDGTHLNIRDKTIEEVYNDSARVELVEAFKNNEQHPNCAVCWSDPYSIRAKFSTFNKHTLEFTTDVMNGKEPEAELKWLEVKPGNRCNLKCRICGVHNSSSWTKDAAALSSPDQKFKETFAYNYTQSCDWIDDPKMWNDIKQLESIEFIHFMGGEPFMVPEHFQLLERLVNSDTDTSEIEIAYNTNGTYFPTEEQFKLYSKFKKVIFGISIDDIGSRFEYQRKLAKWNEVKENIKMFQQKQEHNKIEVNLDPTISVYNIFYLDEIEAEFLALGFPLTKYHDHFVTGGSTDCRMLPIEIKNAILLKLKDDPSQWVQAGLKFLAFDSTPHKDTFNRFVDQTIKLDELRKEKFEDTFSAYFELLKPYWRDTE